MTSSVGNSKSKILQARTKDGVKFGKELRDKDFLFDKGYLNLNHGKLNFDFRLFSYV